MSIFFSIIIPTYNRAGFIAKTIQSILNQTYTNFEVIVVDDGSTDNTEEIVTSIKDSRVNYCKKENAERGAARNYGANLAQGQYINFFDSDDIAYQNHLDAAEKMISKNTNPEVFHLFYDIKNDQGNLVPSPTAIKNINHQIINGNPLSCNGVFIRKDIALINPFSEDRTLSASEDYLLWLQLASKFKIYHNNTVTTTIINHDQRSVININKKGLIKRKELMLKKALNDPDIVKTYSNQLHLLKSNTHSYISLHLALENDKPDSFKYLLRSLKASPLFFLKKRFFAILKHLLF